MTGAVLAEGCEASAIDLKGQASCAAGDAAASVAEQMFNWLVSGATWAVKWTGEAWLSFPEPTIGTADGVPSDTIGQLWGLEGFYILGIAVFGFFVGLMRLMASPSMRAGAGLVRGIVAIITVQSFSIAATALLLDAGNEFSTWVVQRASGKEFGTALADFSGLGGVTNAMLNLGSLNAASSYIAFAVIGFLLLLIAAVAQVALLIVRSALLVVLLVFLPFLASSAFTDAGYKGLSKAVGWIFALILYKPAAGIIYAVGILSMKNAADDAKPEQQMMNLLIAVVIVAAATLALPAMIKWVSPMAGVGASMAFSGGSVAAGAIGTGAAIVSMGATMGASAGAGAAAAAGESGAAGGGAATAAKGVGAGEASGQGAGSVPGDTGAGTPATGGGSGTTGGTSGTGGSDSVIPSAGQGADTTSDAPGDSSSKPTGAGGTDTPRPSSEGGPQAPASTSADAPAVPQGAPPASVSTQPAAPVRPPAEHGRRVAAVADQVGRAASHLGQGARQINPDGSEDKS